MLRCLTRGCQAPIQASAPAWFTLDEDGAFQLWGIGDDAAEITCGDGHPNWTESLQEVLTEAVERLAGGASWRAGRRPRLTLVGSTRNQESANAGDPPPARIIRLRRPAAGEPAPSDSDAMDRLAAYLDGGAEVTAAGVAALVVELCQATHRPVRPPEQHDPGR
jgi:hypothetical protein